jgi:hypothetical protein
MNLEIAKYLIDNFHTSNSSYKTAKLTANQLTLTEENLTSDYIQPELLYVFNFNSGTCDGKTITLNNVNKIIAFTDRPYRLVKEISLDDLDKLWDKDEGSNDFYIDNPNAALYANGKISIIKLSNPKILKNNTLEINFVYTDELVLPDVISTNLNEGVLFIDMTKIRLSRDMTPKIPFYRFVAADSRSPRDGKFLSEDTVPNVKKIKNWLEAG